MTAPLPDGDTTVSGNEAHDAFGAGGAGGAGSGLAGVHEAETGAHAWSVGAGVLGGADEGELEGGVGCDGVVVVCVILVPPPHALNRARAQPKNAREKYLAGFMGFAQKDEPELLPVAFSAR